MRTKQSLLAEDERRDIAACGRSLACSRPAARSAEGAHEPTPTPYFVLDELFSHLVFDEGSRLLDVGCGTGRVLAYFASRGFTGAAVGVELDSDLVTRASLWIERFPQLSVRCANVLDEPLGAYTHIYLFNPFDTPVLARFLDKVEEEIAHPVTVIHMSDNGERYAYAGRPGWSVEHQGSFQWFEGVQVFGYPQTCTIWSYSGRSALSALDNDKKILD